jgi:hypothetical protein
VIESQNKSSKPKPFLPLCTHAVVRAIDRLDAATAIRGDGIADHAGAAVRRQAGRRLFHPQSPLLDKARVFIDVESMERADAIGFRSLAGIPPQR